MDEDSFIKRFPIKILCLMFAFTILIVFLAFNSPGSTENPPANGEVDKGTVSPEKKCKIVPVAITEVGHIPHKVEAIMREFRANAGPRIAAALKLGKKAEPFHPIIIEAASRHEVDPALVKAIIMAESGYNPRAISGQGAEGLMQLMPTTAQALGVEDAFNPEHNINAGVKYFKQLLEEFDEDIELALAAYNAGISKVRQHRGVPPIETTQKYIKKVFRYYRYYKNDVAGEADSV
jgi:hypothetical protein